MRVIYSRKKASGFGFGFTSLESGDGGCAGDGSGEGREDGEDGRGGLHSGAGILMELLA
jgi:hypothetical protein